MSRRILEEQEASFLNNDDYVYIDGQTGGSRKITPENLVRNNTTIMTMQQQIDSLGETETADFDNLSAQIEELQDAPGITDDQIWALYYLFKSAAYSYDGVAQLFEDFKTAFSITDPVNITGISIDQTASVEMNGTKTLQITLSPSLADERYTASWSSADTTIAAVNNGVVTGVAEGTTTISCTVTTRSGNTYTDSCLMTVTRVLQTYTVTYSLSHVTSSNNAAAATENTSYTTTLAAAYGYEIATVTVKMGGTDVTANYYDSETGIISIGATTGDIIISASAAQVNTITFNSYSAPSGAKTVYSDDGVTSIGSVNAYGYGACNVAPIWFSADTVIKVTFTNNTDSTLNKANIFMGSFDPWFDNHIDELCLTYAVSTTAELAPGESVTRTFTVKAGKYPCVWWAVNGSSAYTLTAVTTGTPVTVTVIEEWTIGARPSSLTYYTTGDSSGDATTISNYPYISYSSLPDYSGTKIIRWAGPVTSNNNGVFYIADIGNGEFTGASGQTAGAVTAYNWKEFMENAARIYGLPLLRQITVTSGRQKLLRGGNLQNQFTVLEEVSF